MVAQEGSVTCDSMKLAKVFVLLFFVSVIAELAAVAMHWQPIQFLAKPFIMLCLTGHYLVNAGKRSVSFIFALLFCWAGDVLLLFQVVNSIFFVLGLVTFLIGHVLYIFSYRQFRWAANEKGLLRTQVVRFSFPVILAGTGLIAVLYPTLRHLKGPVIVYAVVLMVMVITALLRYGRTSSESFWMIFIGAVLFMISDSLLAINKFYT